VEEWRHEEGERRRLRYSEEDLLRLMVRAGQVKASNDAAFSRALSGEENPPNTDIVTKVDVRDLVQREMTELFGRLQMPIDTNENFAKTLLKLNRLFERDEGLRKFGGRLLWAIVAGITTMLLTALALKFGLPPGLLH
jgi:hypothetical protein